MTKIALVSEMPEPEAFAALEAEGYMVCVGTIEMEPGRNVNADYYLFDEAKTNVIISRPRQTGVMLAASFNLSVSTLRALEKMEEIRAIRERMLRESNNVRFQTIEFPSKRHFEPKGKAPIPRKYKRNRFSR